MSGWAAAVTRQGIRGLELPTSKDRRTAKWTAITGGLAGTHGHTNALSSQVGATAALVSRLPDLHGMQEVRGSNPLSSTFGCSSRSKAWSQSRFVAVTRDPMAWQYAQLTITRDIRACDIQTILWHGPGQGVGEDFTQRAERAGVIEPGWVWTAGN